MSNTPEKMLPSLVKQPPPTQEWLIQQGLALRKKNEYKQSLRLYAKAVLADPFNSDLNPQYRLGLTYQESGQHRKSAVFFMLLAMQIPVFYTEFRQYNVADSLESIGFLKSAIEFYKMSKELCLLDSDDETKESSLRLADKASKKISTLDSYRNTSNRIKPDPHWEKSNRDYYRYFYLIDSALANHRIELLSREYKYNYKYNELFTTINAGNLQDRILTKIDNASIFSAFAQAQLKTDGEDIPIDDKIIKAFEKVKLRVFSWRNYAQTLQLLCSLAILQPNERKWLIEIVDCLHTWYTAQQKKECPFAAVKKINVVTSNELDNFNNELSIYHASAVLEHLQIIKNIGLDDKNLTHWIYRCMTNMSAEKLIRDSYDVEGLSDHAIRQLAYSLKTLVFEILMQ